jgi:hypothetical protein
MQASARTGLRSLSKQESSTAIRQWQWEDGSRVGLFLLVLKVNYGKWVFSAPLFASVVGRAHSFGQGESVGGFNDQLPFANLYKESSWYDAILDY